MPRVLVFEDGFEPYERDMTPEEAAAIPRIASPVFRVVTALAFMERFTQQERIALRRAAKQNDELDDWLDMLRAAQEVNLDDQRTVAGIQAFVAAGLITAPRAAAILG